MSALRSVSFINILILCSALTITGCSSFRPSFISEKAWRVEDDLTEEIEGQLGGHFDEEGIWIPDDPTIEWTYKVPDISAGFIFDAHSLDVTPSIQVEVLEFDTPLPWPLRTCKVDLGVAYQRAYGYFGPRITSIFEISVGGFVGWNWKDKDLSYGVGFTLIRF